VDARVGVIPIAITLLIVSWAISLLVIGRYAEFGTRVPGVGRGA
jgi:hypothetical protein